MRSTPQIWIIEHPSPLNILDDGRGIYILVNAQYQPILDKTGRPYRSGSIMDAEKQTQTLLQPYLAAITRPR